MGLFGMFERRNALENPSVPLTAASLWEVLGGHASDAGVAVTETGALAMSAVYRATALISGLGGALPLKTYRAGTLEEAPSRLLEGGPHPDMTSYEFWRLSFVHRLLWGNFYAQKKYDSMRRVTELHPISPDRVRVGRVKPSEANPSGKVFLVTEPNGTEHPMTPIEIFHIPGLGYDGVTGVSPIRQAAQGIGLSMAAEKYGAKLFGSGNLIGGVLQTEQRLTPEQATQIKNRWQERMSGIGHAHEVAVLDSGAKFQALTMPNDDAQFLESRVFQITEIARFFGVPPYLLMQTENTTSWGTGLEQQARGFVTFDLHPQWLAPTEQRITKELLPLHPCSFRLLAISPSFSKQLQ